MARLSGPDESCRTVFLTTGPNAGKALAQGMSVPLYADLALSIPADVRSTTDGVIAGTPPTLTVDTYSQIPLFKYPDNVKVVYSSINGGPVVALFARTDDRLDALSAQAAAASAAIGSTQSSVAALDDSTDTRLNALATAAAAAETPAGAQQKANAAAQSAVTAVAGTGPLRAVDGRKYRMILGVIRNMGGPSYWQAINDVAHRPHNIDSVTTDSSTIVVDYSSLSGAKVVSLVVVPDETLAAAGFYAGASVTASAATITLARPASFGDYVSYNGSAWVSQNGVFSNMSFTAGTLSLSHPSMEDPANPFLAHYGVSVTGRGPSLVPQISADSSAVTSTGLKVSWFDWAGALQTTANTNMRAFVSRTAPKALVVNPQTVDNTLFPNSNLWIFGTVEV